MRNYRYKRFIGFPREKQQYYQVRLRYLPPKSVIKVFIFNLRAIEISDIDNIPLSFGDVTNLKKFREKGNTFGAMQIVFRWRGRQVPKILFVFIRLTYLFAAQNHIDKELKMLGKIESNSWEPKQTDPDLKASGSDKLSIFGNYNPATTIAERFGTTPKEVFKWDYIDVFVEIAQKTVVNDVMTEVKKVKAKKAKKTKHRRP